jgi:hypothetical protein
MATPSVVTCEGAEVGVWRWTMDADAGGNTELFEEAVWGHVTECSPSKHNGHEMISVPGTRMPAHIRPGDAHRVIDSLDDHPNR